MSPLEYIADKLDQWQSYVTLLLIFLTLHGALARRWTVGLFDPMLVLLLANTFNCTIVWFMYLHGDIAGAYVASFTLCELALYAGIDLARPARRLLVAPSVPHEQDCHTAVLTLTSAALVHVGSTLAVWMLAGVPLFRDSRLGGFEGSGGLGIFERLAESSALIAAFAVVYALIFRRSLRRNAFLWAFLCWYFIAATLSGSKSAFLSLGQYALSIVFVFTALGRQRDGYWGGRAGKWLFALSAVFAMAVLATQRDGDVGIAAIAFIYRLVNFGDVYIFAYPNATIERLQGDSALVGMFGGFLSTFRLFPQDQIYPNLGYQFTGFIFPNLDLIAGPNPQHPIFGYHYFGVWAPVFSFVLGLITRAVHTNFYRGAHGSFMSALLAFMLLFSLVTVSVDFEYALTRLASIIIGVAVIVGPVLLLRPHVAIFRRRAQIRSQVPVP